MDKLFENVLTLYNNIIIELDFNQKRVLRAFKSNHLFAENDTYHDFCEAFCQEEGLNDDSLNKLELFFSNLSPTKEPLSVIVSLFRKNINTNHNNMIKYELKGLLDNDLFYLTFANMDQLPVDSLDSVTKVYSRGVIIEKTKVEIQKRQPFALVILDIDNFKQFNDSYGHMFGDIILVETIAAIKKILGPRDFIGRIGGDEFLMLIHTPNNSFDEIHKVCSNIKNTIQELSYNNIKQASVTVTLGCSVFPKDGIQYEMLFKKADKALYRGKRKGRNCFVIYSNEKCGAIDDFSFKDNYTNIEEIDKTSSNSQVIVAVYEILARNNAIEKNIMDALSLVGSFFLIERIHLYLHQLLNKQDYWMEWMDPQVKQYAGLIHPKKENFKLWNEQLDQTGMFKFNQVKKQHSDHPFIQLLLSQKTNSILSFQLKMMDKEIGFIRFDTITSNKFWQAPDISTLMVISKFIGITINKLNEQATLEYYAYYDSLTQFYNYTKFRNEVEKVLNTEISPYTILYFDIVGFHQYVNSCGNEYGDKFILVLANAIKDNSFGGIYCREYADRFLLFIEDTLPQNIITIYQRIAKQLKDFYPNDNDIKLRCGIYSAQSSETLPSAIDKAKVALLSTEKSECVFFNMDLAKAYQLQQTIKSQFPKAVNDGTIKVCFKIYEELNTKKIVGVETTSKWLLNQQELTSEDYLPIAKKLGFVNMLELQLFTQLCKFIHTTPLLTKKLTHINFPLISTKLSIEELDKARSQYDINPEYIQIGIPVSNLENDDTELFIKKALNLHYGIYMIGTSQNYEKLLQFQLNKIQIKGKGSQTSYLKTQNKVESISHNMETLGYQTKLNYHVSEPISFEKLIKLLQK